MPLAARFAWIAGAASASLVVTTKPSLERDECHLHDDTSMLQVSVRLAMSLAAAHGRLVGASTLADLKANFSWSGAQANIWTDAQCGNLCNLNNDLVQCQAACVVLPGCSAINHNPTANDCVLRRCPVPVPHPMLHEEGYYGYAQVPESVVAEEWADEQTVSNYAGELPPATVTLAPTSAAVWGTNAVPMPFASSAGEFMPISSQSSGDNAKKVRVIKPSTAASVPEMSTGTFRSANQIKFKPASAQAISAGEYVNPITQIEANNLGR